ncbi:nitrous oxide reductase family maturation protein NosD [Cellulomonas sp. HZM]|uniref:right-handed parallel beta-helix repeat-containing protein n=1 Tax=Cellulomonas sp. HZM TaxID=1454010 RepID=UPI000554C1C1|nr:right-handed parallel beta-helix repeat-containing protein [Cellulomonas sp. HZM]
MLSRPLTALLAACALVAVLATTACGGSGGDRSLVHVPGDVATITKAVDRVAPGGTVLIAPGVYDEQVVVGKRDVTIRGEDRDAVVVDGGGRRPYGVVATADGVRIENLTVRRTTFYGVLVTGLHDENGPSAHDGQGYTHLDPDKFPPVQRFSIDHVTATDNGLYGIYAFDANHGVIRDSYASGSADSGFYVGQCRSCDILVQGNVAERNAVGFENANASDSVVIVGNRFSGNRVGMTLISNYQEAFTPQRANTVVGNLVSDNQQADTPEQATGGWGIGLGISGGQDNVLLRNRITGNVRAGVLLANTEDLAATGNTFTDDVLTGNGVAVANVSAARAPASGNCVTPAAAPTLPADLLADCHGTQPTGTLPAVDVPAGTSFLEVAAPPAQPSMPDPGERGPLPATVTMPDLDTIPVPAADLLADLAGTAQGSS